MLGVLGWPIAHSLSPVMQGAALAALGLDWTYRAIAVPPARLGDAVRGAAALGFRGLNVTIPHKEAVLTFCEPDDLARRVGAVNTLCFREDKTSGHNTDVAGFLALCAEAGCALAPGLRAVVLGGGGAARAVIFALREARCALSVHVRGPGPLVLEGAPLPTAPLCREVLAQELPRCDLLIDATPRGLLEAPTYPELDLALLPSSAVVLDLVVRPQTALVALAARQGLGASTGAPMLLHQGAAALALWLGHPVPAPVVQTMRAALYSALCSTDR